VVATELKDYEFMLLPNELTANGAGGQAEAEAPADCRQKTAMRFVQRAGGGRTTGLDAKAKVKVKVKEWEVGSGDMANG
jgi:hypothetical protein